MNKGGTQKLNDLRVILVEAPAAAGSQSENATVQGGQPARYVLEFENEVLKAARPSSRGTFSTVNLIRDLHRRPLVSVHVSPVRRVT